MTYNAARTFYRKWITIFRAEEFNLINKDLEECIKDAQEAPFLSSASVENRKEVIQYFRELIFSGNPEKMIAGLTYRADNIAFAIGVKEPILNYEDTDEKDEAAWNKKLEDTNNAFINQFVGKEKDMWVAWIKQMNQQIEGIFTS